MRAASWWTGLLLALVAVAPLLTWHLAPNWPVTMRDRAYRMLAAVGVLALVPVEPGLALWMGVIWWHWRRARDLPMLLMAGSAVGVYLAVRALSAELRPWVPWVLLVSCAVQTVYGMDRGVRAWCRGLPTDYRLAVVNGWMGNRVYLGCLGAMTVPLVPWPWCLVPAVTVLASTSSTAAVAVLAGWTAAHPGDWPWTVGLLVAGGLVFWRWHRWRSSPADSWSERTRVWVLLWVDWWRGGWSRRCCGRGYDAVMVQSGWWVAQGRVAQMFKTAHNDALQLVVEYGLLGAAGVVWWVSGSLWVSLGSPWGGSLLAFLLVSLMQSPSRIASSALLGLVIVGLARG